MTSDIHLLSPSPAVYYIPYNLPLSSTLADSVFESVVGHIHISKEKNTDPSRTDKQTDRDGNFDSIFRVNSRH